jgi:hypothetical protein
LFKGDAWMNFELFCPTCYRYVGPLHPKCLCGWLRPADQELPVPGQAAWSLALPGPGRGQVLVSPAGIIFPWGNRSRAGGASLVSATGALLRSWNWGAAFEGGAVVHQGYLYLATLGVSGEGASFVRCSLFQDSPPEMTPLSASVWGAPVIWDNRAYAAAEDGALFCMDTVTGHLVPLASPALLAGTGLQSARIWLAVLNSSLVAVTQAGTVHLLDPVTGRSLWNRPLDLEQEIKAPPAVSAGLLYLGTMEGAILEVDVKARSSSALFSGPGAIVAAPAVGQGELIFGAKDRLLRAVDLRTRQVTWSGACPQTPAVTPVVFQGLVFSGCNDGQVYCFQRPEPAPAWVFPVEGRAPVLASPAVEGGVVYLGAENGQALALPWHLGHFAWAAGHLRDQGEPLPAAHFFAVAAGVEPRPAEHSRGFYTAAVQCFEQAGEMGKAARLYETDLEASPLSIALKYAAAGEAMARYDREQAILLLRSAIQSFEDVEDKERIRDCRLKLARISDMPILIIHGYTDLSGPLRMGEELNLEFRVTNRGSRQALDVRLRVTGNVEKDVWVKPFILLPAQNGIIKAPVIPRESGSLIIEAHYQDEQGNAHFFYHELSMGVQASPRLRINGSVGMLKLDPGSLSSGLEIQGDVGYIKLENPGEEPGG